jgi:hypothetical protein
LGQRSRKRGQRQPPPAKPAATAATKPDPGDSRQRISEARRASASPETFTERYRNRSEEKNAAVRATLTPLEPGEHPWPLLVGIALTGIAGGVQLILYLIGTKVNGKPVPASSLLLFVVLLVCAIGMWRLWYQAVLAFMVLLAIIICLFALLLVEASNILGLVVGLIVVLGGGYLFWKLVRVLGRLQMPVRPGADR